MSELAWTKAATLLKLDRAAGWSASLDLQRLSVLQAGQETKEQKDEARAICATLLDACKAGTVPCESEERTIRPRYTVVRQDPTFARRNLYGERIYTPPPPPPPQRTTTVYRLSPATFASWLAGEGLTPSPLVAAWFKATGTTTSEAPADLAQPAAGVNEAGETIARILKRCALIAELERDWPSIVRNLSEASRNGLKAKAYSDTSKGWDVEKARSWAEANGKLKKNPAAAGWPRHIHKIKG